MDVQLKQITKKFYGTKALDRVELSLKGGEIQCLVGENGAGKSTIIKILAGAYMPDEGEILIDGRKVILRSPRDAQQNKIAVIHQELLLVPEMSVAENIFLGNWPQNLTGFVDKKEMNRMAEDILKRIGTNIRPECRVSSLSTGEQQMVEIAKALSKDIQVLILDEPTASLSEVDANNLIRIVQELKKEGIAILYVSHRLEEVFAIADCITVFRDGKYIGCVKNGEVTKDEVVRMMVGRNAGADKIRERRKTAGTVALEVRNLTRFGKFKNISFQLRTGEVLGIAGLVGAGRTEILRAVFGIDDYDSGQVLVYGKESRFKHPAQAIAQGLSMVPEDRKTQGLILEQSIAYNTVLGILKKIGKKGFISDRKVQQIGEEYKEKLRIKAPTARASAASLSGGNQQKVVLARSLAMKPKILILDEPTRGVDVGAREEIHRLIDSAVEQNLAVLLVSSDILELLSLSDRMIVLKEGEIAGRFNDRNVSKEEVIKLATA